MISWKGFKWLPRETWGLVHPNKPLWWYDESAVEVDGNDTLHLRTHYNPKWQPTINKISPVGAGLVSCTFPFHFGYYRFTCKLPKGKMLFPAIWLYTHQYNDAVGSEIDIMEAYSNRFGNYLNFDPTSLWSLQRVWSAFNHHDGNKRVWVGKQGHKICRTNDTISFEMRWTPDKIIIWCDGVITRKLEGDVMKHYQEPMKLILNNGLRNNCKDFKQETDFRIMDFVYKPK